jgi:hypothetical protein
MVKEILTRSLGEWSVLRPIVLTAYTTNMLNFGHVKRIRIISATYVNKQNLRKLAILHVLLKYEIHVQVWAYT